MKKVRIHTTNLLTQEEIIMEGFMKESTSSILLYDFPTDEDFYIINKGQIKLIEKI